MYHSVYIYEKLIGHFIHHNQKFKYAHSKKQTLDLSTELPHLYSINGITDGTWRRQNNGQSLMFLEAVRQQTVDGAVVIVDVCL